MELVQALALVQKPIVNTLTSLAPESKCDVIANAINAARLFGYTQLIWGESLDDIIQYEGLDKLQKIIKGMAMEEEDFVMSVPIELTKNSVRIDITLEK